MLIMAHRIMAQACESGLWAYFHDWWSEFDHYDPELYFIAHALKFIDHKAIFYRSLSKILCIMIQNLWIMNQNFIDHDSKFGASACQGNFLWLECFGFDSNVLNQIQMFRFKFECFCSNLIHIRMFWIFIETFLLWKIQGFVDVLLDVDSVLQFLSYCS